MRRWLVCRRCGGDLDLGPYFAGCPRCGSALEVTYDYAALDSTTVAALVARSSPGREGLCVEPASAVAAAGLAHGRHAGWISDDEWVVAVLTSSGIKWPQQLSMVTRGAATLEPTLSSLQAALSERGLDSTSAPCGASSR